MMFHYSEPQVISQNQEDGENVYFLKILFKIDIKIDFLDWSCSNILLASADFGS